MAPPSSDAAIRVEASDTHHIDSHLESPTRVSKSWPVGRALGGRECQSSGRFALDRTTRRTHTVANSTQKNPARQKQRRDGLRRLFSKLDSSGIRSRREFRFVDSKTR